MQHRAAAQNFAGFSARLAAAAAVCMASGFGAPARAGAPSATMQPDVQVLVMRDASGSEAVDLTYPKVVAKAAAQGDANAILRETGLQGAQLEISNDALPLAGRTPIPMTSAMFETRGALPLTETTFRLAPWIVALKAHPSLAITFVMPPQFAFNGLRSYRDGNVEIALDRRDSTFTYHVRVLNPSFQTLNLPLMQPDESALRFAQADQRRRGLLRVLGLVCVSALAAAVGYGVYNLLSRLH